MPMKSVPEKRTASCSGFLKRCPPSCSFDRAPECIFPRLPEVSHAASALAHRDRGSPRRFPRRRADAAGAAVGAGPRRPAASARSRRTRGRGASPRAPRRFSSTSRSSTAGRTTSSKRTRRSRSSPRAPRTRPSASSGSRPAPTSTRRTGSCTSKTSPSRARASRRRRTRRPPGSRRCTSSSRRSARRPSRSTGSRRISASSPPRRRASRVRWTTLLRRSSSRTFPRSSCSIAGQPAYRPQAGTDLQRLINTSSIVLKASSGELYLHLFDGWMEASSIQGPWKVSDPRLGRKDNLEKALKDIVAAKTGDPMTGGSASDPKAPKPSLKTKPVPVVYMATPADRAHRRRRPAQLPGDPGHAAALHQEHDRPRLQGHREPEHLRAHRRPLVQRARHLRPVAVRPARQPACGLREDPRRKPDGERRRPPCPARRRRRRPSSRRRFLRRRRCSAPPRRRR